MVGKIVSFRTRYMYNENIYSKVCFTRVISL
jgi:hypothetical protein